MRRLFRLALVLALPGLAAFWFITRPNPLPADALVGLVADPAHGEQVFWAGGCASCHMTAGAKGDQMLELGGGQKFPSPFGTFIAPNISNDPIQGVGGWSSDDLANAMMRGISPEGTHYYPAFPYASYAKATPQDVVDLRAYLATLPAVATPSQPHEVGFPFNLRRTLGGWKFLFLNTDWVIAGDLTPDETRGRYLAEALGHCAECHTPRNLLGGLQRDQWLAGAPIPGAKGRFPNITPARLKWSAAEIADYLNTGFTPEYDSAGGHMALVVGNFARLSAEDRSAVAAYLKKVPPIETPATAPAR
ncbi:c-type cytochrome [Phaeovulum sp.]|uniref:c-type cytochrome n=1 Tax=Phaeovulum sp. TaxID=2934796 RepID=UPI0039E2917E